MASTLDEIRKKLQAMESQKGGGANKYSNDKLTYAHWTIPDGTQSILRLLPDGNKDNTFFWVERQVIKLPFPGIKGHDEHKPMFVQVPCIEMWDGKNTCPILNEVRPMWKDAALEATARTYWVKRTYYAQGFVKQDGGAETDPPENPIRKFIIGPAIYKIFQAALMDTDMEHSPVDYINGTDFIVAKTAKGGFADYGTSKWARKESSLTQDQLDAIEKYGLPDLSEYLPKRPTPEHLNAMFEMFQASLDGELYDPAKWAQYYKPFGFDSAPAGDDDGGEGRSYGRSAPAVKPSTPAYVKPATLAEAVEDVPAPKQALVETTDGLVGASTAPASKSPQEILAMLRNRNRQ